MAHRIGAQGQVVIPKDLRDRAGLHPRAEVDFELDGERVTLVRQPPAAALGGRFRGSGMAQRLVEDRAREPK